MSSKHHTLTIHATGSPYDDSHPAHPKNVAARFIDELKGAGHAVKATITHGEHEEL
jgi:hypothetical protein